MALKNEDISITNMRQEDSNQKSLGLNRKKAIPEPQPEALLPFPFKGNEN